ncbi:carbohydrate ABC transporter permease [Streptomyces sp. YC504]|uniref:Carbohydrate ABC transporter permease n=1 Tax=Streptomyces mesophilus TaxID=1775132 RepID=A0A6G4XCY7_9ACTN|nr:carbohydrate ABC transporter permease [Streptomyces mesophilus]NGO75409.1 carbohydrate ABC transporter permease [Streptomyces mesophilus]
MTTPAISLFKRRTDTFKGRTDGRPPWMERPTWYGQGLKVLVLGAIVVAVGYPFLIALGTSLAGKEEIAANGGYVMFPTEPTLQAYEAVLSGGVVTRAALVSIGVTLVGTALSLLCTIALAYGLSRPGTVAGKPILFLVLGTFLFTPGIIPVYLVVDQLGMIDSYASLIVPIMLNAFNIVIVRAFFQGIPDELHEAARLDGAGEITILWRIVLPLSKAVLAVVGMFYAVSYWNNFFNAMLYINDGAKLPLQMVLRSYVLQGDTINESAMGVSSLPPSSATQMAVLLLAIVPIIAVYPFLQRHFTKGVLTGAVKG